MMRSPRARLIVLTVLLAAGLFWWFLASGPTADRDPLPDDTTTDASRPTLTGTPMGAAAGAAEANETAAADEPAVPTPGPSVLLPAQQAAITAAELRKAGFDQRLGPGTAGGVVLVGDKPVEDGEALLWKVTDHIGTARGIPVAREPDARIVLSRDGRFRFDGLEPGLYLIGTMLADGTPRLLWNQFRVDKARDEDLIVLGSDAIEGMVYDETGAPAEGWRARVSNQAGVGTIVSEVAVASDGTFRIASLAPGGYWVSVDDPESEDANISVTQALTLKAGEVARVTFGSASPLRFTGTARFRDGEPIRGPGRIVAYRPDHSMAIIAYDEQGAYDHQIEAGTWSFRFDFSHRHRTVLVAGVEITKADAARDLTLECTRIEGHVLHGPDVVPMYVRIWPVDGRWQDGDAVRVDADGRYYMPGVKTGRWNLRAETRQVIDAEIVVIEIRADDGLREIDLRM